MKLCVLCPKKVVKLFLTEGADHKGYPILRKEDLLQSTGVTFASKEEMAQDPVQMLPMLKIIADQDAALMSAIWDSTIYTVNKPAPEDEAGWLRTLRPFLANGGLLQ